MKKPPIPEQSWPADAVSRVPTASLIPYARNARPEPQVEEFLTTLDLGTRKVPEYTRLLNAFCEWQRAV